MATEPSSRLDFWEYFTMSQFVVYTHRCTGGKIPSVQEQEVAAQAFVSANQGEIIAGFTESRIGRRVSWSALQQAIDKALSSGATLVIAHVGRLSRSATFTALLLQSGVLFVCCDMPDCNHLTIHIIATTAEQESNRIRTKIRNSLAAAKAAGVKLGSQRAGHWEGREHLRGWRKAYVRSIEVRKQRTALAYQAILPEIKARRERGETLLKIVEWLNGDNHLTTAGKPFTQTAVWRIIARYLGKEYLGSVRRKKGTLTAGSEVGIVTAPHR